MKQCYVALLPAFLFAHSAFTQCVVEIPQDTVTVYHGYAPLSCADIAAAAEGEEPVTLTWSSGSSTPMITVCDTLSGWYYVALVDGDGCTATDSVYVNVVDVRCGNNNNKVLVCHLPPGNPSNMQQICIGAPAVAAHLAHGCLLGPCEAAPTDSLQAGGELQIQVSPNPMMERAVATIRSTVSQRVTLTGVDATGRVVQLFFEGDLPAGTERMVFLDQAEMPERTRIVWLRLQGASGTVVQRALVIGG